MMLYILRHADAESFADTDAERRLSPRGIAQAQTAARFIKEKGITVTHLISSPFRRAVETAEPIANELKIEIQPDNFLSSGMSPSTALSELKYYLKDPNARVMIVGHEPDFSQLIATLVGGASHSNFEVKKASITCLECERLQPGTGILRFSIPVEMMS